MLHAVAWESYSIQRAKVTRMMRNASVELVLYEKSVWHTL